MKASENLLQFLINLSAAFAHILGSDRPVNAWAWRIGSRSCQFSLFAALIAVPVSFVGLPFGLAWVWTWTGCWTFQILIAVREFYGLYRRNRKA